MDNKLEIHGTRLQRQIPTAEKYKLFSRNIQQEWINKMRKNAYFYGYSSHRQ